MFFHRVFKDLIMSVFCLYIPCLFMGHSSHQRVDKENSMRNQGPILIIGACDCLMVSQSLPSSGPPMSDLLVADRCDLERVCDTTHSSRAG